MFVVGRVRTMMLGSLLNSIGMCLLAGGIAHIDKKPAAYAAATGLYLFIVSFSMTWLPCGWIYGAEVSALAVRSQASALGNAVQYLFNCESHLSRLWSTGLRKLTYR